LRGLAPEIVSALIAPFVLDLIYFGVCSVYIIML
jgi:hypothetical protein